MSNIVRSSMLLTTATFLSKFLGMVYLIPFNALVGAAGGTLYTFAYVPYNIMLSISTVGIPLAMSKIVSKYNSLGDYETGRRMFKSASGLMLITGLVSFLILFFAAEQIANFSISTNDQYSAITVEDAVIVIRAVSFALIIIPAMSIVRGFFQGYESMGPTAISQVVEQIVRILFVLVSVFMVIVIFKGTIATAVGFATFGAFVGAIGSWIILLSYWKKRKPYLDTQLARQKHFNHIPTKKLYREILSYSGPFIIVGLATSLYQLVDQFTFQRAMVAGGHAGWDIAYGAINMYGHKLVIIPGTIATGLSLAILPAMTKTFSQKNMPVLHQQINQSLQIVLVLVIPAVVGLCVLSHEAYGTLYGMQNLSLTGSLMAWYAPVGLLFSLFTVTAAILQGINKQNFTVLSLMAGLLVKILLNSQLIHMFGAKGAIFGTALAAGIAVSLNLYRIKVSIQFPLKQLIKRTLLIIIFVTLMSITIWIVKAVFGLFIPYEDTRWGAMVILILGVGLGGAVYLYFAYASTLLERVFGGQIPFVNKIKRKFGR
ncbi:putative polysaccharide biosynthesis protein [Oceanobacillus bengalensis]|uniref:Polysaccharide biosynthesis protein n=1 Tax=Oceanobacillus bengalensis TaxID=1435466 RepID=A0A494YWK9_9BACI|nr:polysaccharide biosynthesis protein [Oceanobacillus bengalensis]RKQ14532.1 polysaccharide biosynthesis protein [Oceanobacillus bengalensis]